MYVFGLRTMEEFEYLDGDVDLGFAERDILLGVVELLLNEGEPIPVDILAQLETHGIIIEEIANG